MKKNGAFVTRMLEESWPNAVNIAKLLFIKKIHQQKQAGAQCQANNI